MYDLLISIATSMAHAVVGFGDWIVNNKEIIGMCLVAAGGVSSILERVKHALEIADTKISAHIKMLRFIPFIKNIPTVTVLHYLLALIPVAVHYLQGSHSTNPIVILAQAFILVGSNQFIYPTFVKPVSQVFADAKAQAAVNKAAKEAAEALNAFQG